MHNDCLAFQPGSFLFHALFPFYRLAARNLEKIILKNLARYAWKLLI